MTARRDSQISLERWEAYRKEMKAKIISFPTMKIFERLNVVAEAQRMALTVASCEIEQRDTNGYAIQYGEMAAMALWCLGQCYYDALAVKFDDEVKWQKQWQLENYLLSRPKWWDDVEAGK